MTWCMYILCVPVRVWVWRGDTAMMYESVCVHCVRVYVHQFAHATSHAFAWDDPLSPPCSLDKHHRRRHLCLCRQCGRDVCRPVRVDPGL
jgi:hypothetical protein